MVDFYRIWYWCVDDYVTDNQFAKYKSITGESGEELEERVEPGELMPKKESQTT
ncbi:hypothetical protein [Spirosoma foliorum]|uniref:Uncharacterized protein n=1 Tax=Spirosoma foliorum TaxID=2710596 RepID=A0A7G5GP32_9BACT|nr:hypothetical protein [Spirosoma foliorum]QMW00624.1 hypothetical protein H3H32_21820 [Spirosoma foliorum]